MSQNAALCGNELIHFEGDIYPGQPMQSNRADFSGKVFFFFDSVDFQGPYSSIIP